MKKNIYSALFIVLFAGNLAAQSDVSAARWQTVKVKADGNDNEWRKPLNLYDRLSGLLFTVSNDSSYLYLCFAANDERKINKLMKAGWSVEISSKEKKKKFEASMIFPGVEIPGSGEKTDDVMQGVRTDFKNEFALYKLNLAGASTKGFVSGVENIPLQNANGINIGIGSDSTQKFIAEFSIPFKELFPDNNFALNEELTLSVSVNGLPKPKYGSTEPSTSFNGGGRMGGGRHNGRGGGNTNGSDKMADYQAEKAGLFEKTNFKQKFTLAIH